MNPPIGLIGGAAHLRKSTVIDIAGRLAGAPACGMWFFPQ
jgi:hypothetical protein